MLFFLTFLDIISSVCGHIMSSPTVTKIAISVRGPDSQFEQMECCYFKVLNTYKRKPQTQVMVPNDTLNQRINITALKYKTY